MSFIPREPVVKVVKKRKIPRLSLAQEKDSEQPEVATQIEEDTSTKSSGSIYVTQIERQSATSATKTSVKRSGDTDSDTSDDSQKDGGSDSGSHSSSPGSSPSKSISNKLPTDIKNSTSTIANSEDSSEEDSRSSNSDSDSSSENRFSKSLSKQNSSTPTTTSNSSPRIKEDVVTPVKEVENKVSFDLEKNGAGKKKKKKQRSRSRFKRDGYTYELITGIHLHSTSKLKFNIAVKAPRIKVSWYDTRKGQLVEKSHLKRNVILNYEPDSLEYIQPIISKRGEIRNEDEFAFTWDETLIINEDFEFMRNLNFVIFFEIIDMKIHQQNRLSGIFSSCVVTNHKCGGWYRICWAFLRPSTERSSNFDKRCKLQLYKYKKISKKYSIYDQWNEKKRKKYPATLDITLTSVKPLQTNVGFTRPHTALQDDKRKSPSLSSLSEVESELPGKENMIPLLKTSKALIQQQTDNSKWLQAWNMLKVRAYKSPDTLLNSKLFEKGSTACQFSPDGKLIAFSDNTDILVASVPDLKVIHSLKAHTGAIHSLRWMPGNTKELPPKILVSCSEDRSCIIWFLEKEGRTLQVLPHPSFVYSATFLTNDDDCIGIATGGRDAILRVWMISTKQGQIKLLQELSDHKSFIVGICHGAQRKAMYSSDIDGTIIEWKFSEKKEWLFSRQIAIIPEKVQQMHLHPKINRLYAITDMALYSVDVLSGLPRRTLIEIGPTKRTNINRFILSKCGSYLFLTTGDNTVMACNLIQETVLNSISIALPPSSIIHSLDWYPIYNLLAVSTYGKQAGGVLLYSSINMEETRKEKLLLKQKDNISLTKSNETLIIKNVNKPQSAANHNWDLILDRFDELFKSKASVILNETDDRKVDNIQDDKGSIHESDTRSVASNCTYTVTEEGDGGNTYKVERNETKPLRNRSNTFTIEPIKNADDTDISESLESTEEE